MILNLNPVPTSIQNLLNFQLSIKILLIRIFYVDNWSYVLYMTNHVLPIEFIAPLKSKRTFEEIADQIRELIYSGVFKPGELEKSF